MGQRRIGQQNDSTLMNLSPISRFLSYWQSLAGWDASTMLSLFAQGLFLWRFEIIKEREGKKKIAGLRCCFSVDYSID